VRFEASDFTYAPWRDERTPSVKYTPTTFTTTVIPNGVVTYSTGSSRLKVWIRARRMRKRSGFSD
jgi:hypothetical protein